MGLTNTKVKLLEELIKLLCDKVKSNKTIYHATCIPKRTKHKIMTIPYHYTYCKGHFPSLIKHN